MNLAGNTLGNTTLAIHFTIFLFKWKHAIFQIDLSSIITPVTGDVCRHVVCQSLCWMCEYCAKALKCIYSFPPDFQKKHWISVVYVLWGKNISHYYLISSQSSKAFFFPYIFLPFPLHFDATELLSSNSLRVVSLAGRRVSPDFPALLSILFAPNPTYPSSLSCLLSFSLPP